MAGAASSSFRPTSPRSAGKPTPNHSSAAAASGPDYRCQLHARAGDGQSCSVVPSHRRRSIFDRSACMPMSAARPAMPTMRPQHSTSLRPQASTTGRSAMSIRVRYLRPQPSDGRLSRKSPGTQRPGVRAARLLSGRCGYTRTCASPVCGDEPCPLGAPRVVYSGSTTRIDALDERARERARSCSRV